MYILSLDLKFLGIVVIFLVSIQNFSEIFETFKIDVLKLEHGEHPKFSHEAPAKQQAHTRTQT